MGKMKRIMGILLAAALLVSAAPADVSAADLTLRGNGGKAQETEAEKKDTEGSKEGKQEEGQEKNDSSRQKEEQKEEQKQNTETEKEGEEDNKKQPGTESGTGKEGIRISEDGSFLKNGKKEYGSPEDEPYDFTGVVPNDEEPGDYDRYAYDPMEKEPMLMGIETQTGLTADIAKRVEWTDKSNGDGKVTLMYKSNSGSYSGSVDMNVVLVQDKSGSMDPNYGFNIALMQHSLDIGSASHWYYPCRNTEGWTESSADCVGTDYRNGLNTEPNQMFDYGMWTTEMTFNSPTQDVNGLYFYQMIQDDANSPGLRAGQMVHGNNLYNISSTDLHCYKMLSGRDEALSYLAAGRRVIRCSDWVNMLSKHFTDEKYFLDMSQIYSFNGKTLLRTCDDYAESTEASRLAKSQWFMDKILKDIQRLNPNNKVAYVPFWGDVPDNGSWHNASSNGSTDNLYDDTYAGSISYKPGVGYMGFTSDWDAVKRQVDNPFTYGGTNWSRAFQKAIDILDCRNADDKKKPTLVLFLTDGMPQGTSGNPTDVDNPYINGVDQIRTLKGMDGVQVYACGVGINQQDHSLRARINNLDSKGRAEFAQYVSGFDRLYSNILNRLNEDFYVPIKGQDAFYTDQLSGPFTLDESKLDKSWKVLASPGSGMTKGVPTSVYNAVKNDGNIKHVYVRSTKTVYWHIGTMTDGGYSAAGHQHSFQIKYSGYGTSTDGADKAAAANTAQKLTYTSSANTNQLKSVDLSTPSLVFNRDPLPAITINKTVDGSSFTSDQTYRFAYCKSKQSGKVVDRAGTATVTVKKGQTSGSAVVSNVQPGTYYVYEIDANDNIISSQVGTAVVSMTPAITTKAKSGSIPASVTTSDGTAMDNNNNHLKITRKNAAVDFTNHYVKVDVMKAWDDSGSSRRPASVTVNLLKNGTKASSKTVSAAQGWKCTFENLDKYDASGKEISYTVTEDAVKDYKEKIEYTKAAKSIGAKITNTLMVADLTVEKTIPADADTIWWDHGEPTFMVKVSGKGLDGKSHTFYHTFVFTEEYVKTHAKDGRVTMSHTFKDIPNSTDYLCEELCVSRWRLTGIEGNGNNVTVTKGTTPSGAELFATHANADVKARPEGTAVTFTNTKDDYQWLNHVTSVHNVIKETTE